MVELTGTDVACATCGCRGTLGDAGRIEWTDRTTSVLSMNEKRAHAVEIQETATRHREARATIAEREATIPMFDPVSPR